MASSLSLSAPAFAETAVTPKWFQASFGVGIGATGLFVADLNADGVPEAVATAGPQDFMSDSYWYVLSRQGTGYVQSWLSFPSPASIQALRVVQADADPALEVLVASGNQLQVYDGSTLAVQRTLTLPISATQALKVADVDADGALELVFCDTLGSTLYVVDLATGAVEFQGANLGGKDLAVGQVDGDPALEIIVGNGASAGFVVDGQTHAVQWTNSSGFGDIVRTGDLTGDGLDEIIAGFTWTTGLRVYKGGTQTLAYTVPVFNLAAVRVADVEGDGPRELLYGDAQWGGIHVLNGATGAQKWTVSNPESGVTDITVGNLDGDAAQELLWGAGYNSTGPDVLYVADAATRTRDWQSVNKPGRFQALAVGDVDADGHTELLYGSNTPGSGDGFFFVHDGSTHALEYQSGRPTGTTSVGVERIRAANVDADPQQEVFVGVEGPADGLLICYDGLTHAEQWRVKYTGMSVLGLQLADVDGDGALEVVTSLGMETTNQGISVNVHDAATGALKWKSVVPRGAFLYQLRVANVDADPAQEILVSNEQGTLMILDASTRTWQLDTTSLGITSLDTADLDGDGRSEIIAGVWKGSVQVLNPATGAVDQTIFSTTGPIWALAVADLTGDGVKDYAFTSPDRLRIVNGATHVEEWNSGVLGADVGTQDGVLVADLDGDNRSEVIVGAGLMGVMVYDVSSRGGLAVYDPDLQAPQCAQPAASCDSGLLLTGRGTVGPELHASNTLYGACVDGNRGTFHSDESIDRLRVVSVDGTPLAAGKTVRIEATVWAWEQPGSDRLELYTAADASTPQWQPLITLTPSAAGAQSLSATYVLPAGNLQAIRARFRTPGSQPCGPGTFTDTDDLVFAVQ